MDDEYWDRSMILIPLAAIFGIALIIGIIGGAWMVLQEDGGGGDDEITHWLVVEGLGGSGTDYVIEFPAEIEVKDEEEVGGYYVTWDGGDSKTELDDGGYTVEGTVGSGADGLRFAGDPDKVEVVCVSDSDDLDIHTDKGSMNNAPEDQACG